MTSPGRYRNEPADIVDELNRLKRRVDALEQNPRIGNTSIDAGRLTITDSSGNKTIIVGLLDDGSYDIAVVNVATGEEVRLAALAFGQRSAFDATTAIVNGVTGMAYSNPNTGTTGPSVTVTVGESRRCKVTIASAMDYASTAPIINASAGVSFDCNGATTFGATTVWAIGELNAVNPPVGGTVYRRILQTSSTTIFDPSLPGLPPLNAGVNTFTMLYKAGTTGVNASFTDRFILAEPF